MLVASSPGSVRPAGAGPRTRCDLVICCGFIALVNWIVTCREKIDVSATSGAVLSLRVKVIGPVGTRALPSLEMIGPVTMKV